MTGHEENLRQRPVSAATGIAFEDYRRMETVDHEGQKEWIPAPVWANSNTRLIHVVSARLACMGRLPFVPRTLEELRKVEPMITRKLADDPATAQHVEVTRRWGGPVAFWYSLAYRRFRLGMDSVTLAEYYGVKPTSIRVMVNRLTLVARRLYPEPEWHKDWHHTATNRDLEPLDLRRWATEYTGGAAPLLKEDLPWTDIEKRTGLSRRTIIRRLKLAGLYQPRKDGPKQKVPIDRVMRLWRQGVSQTEIARRVGFTRQAVAKVIAKEAAHGLTQSNA